MREATSQSNISHLSSDSDRTIPTACQPQVAAKGKFSFFDFLVLVISAIQHLFNLCRAAQPQTRLDVREVKRVVIIGAGPIGLSTAIQTKLKNPEADIVMLEKYDQYARNHTLQIDQHCFNACQLDGVDEITEQLQHLQTRLHNQHFRIRCDELEEELRNIAITAGISIQKGETETVMGITPDHVLVKGDSDSTGQYQQVPYDILIGADGAHSKTRKAIIEMMRQDAQNPDNPETAVMFSDLSQKDNDTEFVGGQHIIKHRVRVKYGIQQDTGVMNSGFRNFVRLVYPTIKRMDSIVHEHISRDDQGNLWVTADFFIDQDEHDALKDNGHDMKNPADLKSSHLPASLRHKIETWQAVKHGYCNEVKILGSENISPYRIGSFHAEQPYYITNAGKPIFLTGDALTGLAFMRALNNGLHNSTYIGDQIASMDTSSLEEVGDRFRLYTRLRYKKERFTAALKTALLNILLWFLNVSNHVPWQTNRFTSADINHLIENMNQQIRHQASASSDTGPAQPITGDIATSAARLIAVA